MTSENAPRISIVEVDLPVVNNLKGLLARNKEVARDEGLQGEVNLCLEQLESRGFTITFEDLEELGFTKKEVDLLNTIRTLYEKRVH